MVKENTLLILSGVVVGAVMIALSLSGNPPNAAFCSACFIRDAAGALGLHKSAAYMRPEIPGVVIGAFAVAKFGGDFTARGGSAPFTRFILGVCVMVGAIIFLGCPFRMILRLAGGDLNAVPGFAGFIAGSAAGALFLRAGFTLKRAYVLPEAEGYLFPAVNLLLVILVITSPALFFLSGTGSAHAPVIVSLAGGIIIGGVGRRMRLCLVSGARDFFLFRQYGMIFCFTAVFVTVFAGNVAFGNFRLGFADQPTAHGDILWNFLGLTLVGFASALLGGCPFRQLVLAGGGNTDSAITVLGFVTGAAVSHNFGLVSTPDGPTVAGKLAFAVCAAAALAVAVADTKKTTTGEIGA